MYDSILIIEAKPNSYLFLYFLLFYPMHWFRQDLGCFPAVIAKRLLSNTNKSTPAMGDEDLLRK